MTASNSVYGSAHGSNPPMRPFSHEPHTSSTRAPEPNAGDLSLCVAQRRRDILDDLVRAIFVPPNEPSGRNNAPALSLDPPPGERSGNVLVERLGKDFPSGLPKLLGLVDPPQCAIGRDALTLEYASLNLRQIHLGPSLSNGLVHVTGDESHVRDVVGGRSHALGKLRAREDVVPVHVVLKNDLAAGVKIKEALVQAGDVEREKAAAIGEGTRKVLRHSRQRCPHRPEIG